MEYEDIYRHLEGKNLDGQDVIGSYAILADNKCNFLCADFDDKSCEHGYKKLPASKARRLGNTILTEAMERYGRMTFKSYDRFFPNQDRLPEGGFGNLVALPLQGKARKEGNSVFVKAESTSKCNTGQNYNKSLKNSSFGVEKFNFSLDLRLIFSCTEWMNSSPSSRKSVPLGMYWRMSLFMFSILPEA